MEARDGAPLGRSLWRCDAGVTARAKGCNFIMVEERRQWRPHLEPGEDLLWVGSAHRGLIFGLADVPGLIIGLVLAAGAIYFGFFADAANSPTTVPGFPTKSSPFFQVVTLVLAAGGLFVAIGWHLLDAFLRWHTAYAVTDRRALILSRFPRTTLKSILIEPELVIRKIGGEVAQIQFDEAMGRSARRSQSPPFYWSNRFLLSEAPDRPYKVLIELLERSRADAENDAWN